MRCGNGTERAQHPIELWGEDWESVGREAEGDEPRESADPIADPPGSAATPR